MTYEIAPTSGPPAGGTVVTIKGEERWDEQTLLFTTVMFGENAATEVKIHNKDPETGTSYTISARSPAGSGWVDVTVKRPNGDATEAKAFAYTTNDRKPTVTGVDPAEGRLSDAFAGKIVVVIKGTDFIDVEEVKFGDWPAPGFRSHSDKEIWALVPEVEKAQGVKVKVKTLSGESEGKVQFEYKEYTP